MRGLNFGLGITVRNIGYAHIICIKNYDIWPIARQTGNGKAKE
jgi:hypothetical protein